MENEILSSLKYPESHQALPNLHYSSPTPFSHKELKKSIETIVAGSNTKKNPNPLENMLSDKAKTLKASVVALLEEIKLREDLNSRHFNKMDREIRKLHSELMNLENVGVTYPNELLREINEARSRIKDNVLELEREKRSEGLECWRDLMFLKKYLMVALKDYWELKRRRKALEGCPKK